LCRLPAGRSLRSTGKADAIGTGDNFSLSHL
jgi:hypothetical protein